MCVYVFFIYAVHAWNEQKYKRKKFDFLSFGECFGGATLSKHSQNNVNHFRKMFQRQLFNFMK